MAGEDRLPSDALGAAGLATLLAIIGTLVGDTTLGILIVLIDYLLLTYAMFRVPLRTSLLTLTFLVMTLPNPNDCTPGWKAPFSVAGAVLLNHWNAVDRSISWLSFASFSGLDLVLLTLWMVHLFRNATGSRIDRNGRVLGPDVLSKLAKIALVTIAFVWINGMVRGGDFGKSLWQIALVVYVPCLYLLFNVGLRGPKDYLALAKVLLAAATYKALLAIYVRQVIKFVPVDAPGSEPVPLPHATSHQDSMLFAVALVILAALFLERAVKRRKWLLAMLPIIIGLGMQANNRRLAWVQVALVLLMVYIVSADNPIKRKIRRALMFAAPVAALYVMAGWNSEYSSVFKPVRMLRSVTEPKSDGSSLWRELENFNLIATLKHNPILGSGYGHPYEEVIVLPAVDYDLERFAPHNSILGLWAFCGYIGWCGLTMLWSAGVYFAVRAYHASKIGAERAAALVSFGGVLIYLVQCWGDLGLGAPIGLFIASLAIAAAGKLAVASDQWPTNSPSLPRSRQ